MRVRLGVLLAVVGGTLSVGAAEASAALEPCKHAPSGRSCARLVVPLDRSGKVPGTVALRIERQKAKRSTRPPLFLVAGGPGQSATDAFDSEVVEDLVGTEARSRDVVVMDVRGTGRSGALNCPVLQRGSMKTVDVAACAAALGPRRDFYSSVDIAQDIDAVREALGAERIALYGVSYGTYVAQVYAHNYPTRVDRVVLDSVVGPTGVDAFQRSNMAAVPTALESICGRRSCRRFMRDPVGTVRRLARRLDRRPLAGYVVDRHGRRQRATIDGDELLDLAVAYPFPSSGFPGAVAAAVRGDSAPLLRLHSDLARILLVTTTVQVRESSAAATVATLCTDTDLPWSSATLMDARRASAATLADALPADAFAPFGRRTALGNRVLEACLGWPSSTRAAPSAAPLPDVPALLLAGGADANTPVEDARALQSLLPRSELMVVPAAGHGVIESGTGCVGQAVRRFLAGGVAGNCGRPLADRAGQLPLPPPTSLRRLAPTGLQGRPGRTVTAAQLTLLDGFQSLIAAAFLDLLQHEGKVAAGRVPRVGALRGGSFVGTRQGFNVRQASFVPGVRVSGTVRSGGFNRLRGSFEVTGRTAAHGQLRLRHEILSGTIAGRRVRVRFPLFDRAFGIRSRASRAGLRRVQAWRSLAPAGLWP